MTRSNHEIITQIKDILETRVAPAVSHHGGFVNFISYDEGILKLQMAGACSGCAGSTTTIRFGVENMMKHYVPEVTEIISEDEENSSVEPYYQKDTIDVIDIK
ncbi:MAG: NifU family protein [Methylophagaceae bacterium]|jgi:Fe-S cluster biogenesis protein NfuA|tara:strand:- start:241 stop:549 length:309 start_codon:yes stop_codon:yes gene_type:complete